MIRNLTNLTKHTCGIPQRITISRINSSDDAAISCENLGDFGRVTPEVMRVDWEIFQTTKQKNWVKIAILGQISKNVLGIYRFGRHRNGDN